MTDSLTLPSAFEILRGKKIYFGHQSVGQDILLGLKELAHQAGSPPLEITETLIGRNGDPGSKCASFDAIVAELPTPPDIALMKFCYADFGSGTNASEVFLQYERTLQRVEMRYPGIRVVPATAPLTAPPQGWKSTIKNWLRRPDEETLANLKRAEFNSMVMARWTGRPVFDLAAAESTYADGRRRVTLLDGHPIYSLIPEYTSDGGHLNAAGRRAVASKLLEALARAART